MENAYQQHFLRQDTLQSCIGISIICVASLVLIFSDTILLKSSDQFYELVTVRLTFVLLSIALIIFLIRNTSYSWLNNTVFIWLLVLCTYSLYVNLFWPPEYTHNNMGNVLAVIAIYILFPKNNRVI